MRSGGRFLLVLWLLAPLLAACETAPVTGRSQLMLVSESEERQMGERAYSQLLARELEVRDGGWATTTCPRPGRAATTASAAPRLLEQWTATTSPRSANAFATAAPMPRDPPVTRTRRELMPRSLPHRC